MQPEEKEGHAAHQAGGGEAGRDPVPEKGIIEICIFFLWPVLGILPVLKDFNFADPHWFSPDSYYLKSSLDPTGTIDVNFKIMFKKKESLYI